MNNLEDKTDIKVSIVLPTYNGEKYLAQAIESVLNQTYKNLELIIVDDCSNDNTPEIIQRYATRDNRITVVTNPTNLKLPMALNEGFKLATGEYYTWTSDDNYYENTAIEIMVNYLQKHKEISMVCCDMEILHCDYNNRQYRHINVSPEQIAVWSCAGGCFMYTQNIAKIVGEYDPKTFLAEDYDFWFRIVLAGGKIGNINQCLYTYRLHNNNLSATKQNDFWPAYNAVQKKYRKLVYAKYPKARIAVCAYNIKRFMQQIFSIQNVYTNKIVNICGIKFKFRNKYKELEFEINKLKKELYEIKNTINP